MNDYILFDAHLRDRFLKFVTDHDLQYTVRPDRMEGYVVTLPDGLDEELEEAIEDAYEALMEEQQSLVETADHEAARSLMAVAVTLPDGQPCEVRIPAIYARRLHEHFSVEEIHALVTAIAESVANPCDGPLCCDR